MCWLSLAREFIFVHAEYGSLFCPMKGLYRALGVINRAVRVEHGSWLTPVEIIHCCSARHLRLGTLTGYTRRRLMVSESQAECGSTSKFVIG
jgi:hypothetical protein